ncbi:hypothetical protein EG850_04315 [Gulosibacter macacae]|uniref:Transcription elongation factor n=1 Tax=Gulosibacter macacae TaxID=2488791 RepID=A0A3P3VXV6_9MICO|nr:hypothetical protein [Gulosibacter macacae]RRJ87530.1 hypothetical protein EG850_04315 [Gulosibacter macacae]
MSELNLDAAAKLRIQEALASALRADIAAAEANAEEQRAASKVDRTQSHTVDDLSQADAAADISAIDRASADAQREALKRVLSLGFEPRDTVGDGAVIELDGEFFVVGVVAATFESEGNEFQGISPDAPIYPAIEGLRAGDEFTFNGVKHRIDSVA